MHGFIIAHAFLNRWQFNRAGDLLIVSALDAAQLDGKEIHNKQLRHVPRHAQ